MMAHPPKYTHCRIYSLFHMKVGIPLAISPIYSITFLISYFCCTTIDLHENLTCNFVDFIYLKKIVLLTSILSGYVLCSYHSIATMRS